MIMKNILFYNLWHNGDVFSGRGYIQAIIESLPGTKFGYYHINNPKIVSDLITMQFKPDLGKWHVKQLEYSKIFETKETIYINTWAGAYFYQFLDSIVNFKEFIANLPGEEHANYLSLHKIYTFVTNYLNTNHNCNIRLDNDPLKYVPAIRWNKYDVHLADEFFKKVEGKKHLICNGKVRSKQSSLDNLSDMIQFIAKKFPSDSFICTEKFETTLSNIFFTNDIFNLDNDLNEIAYLSTYCDTIMGKNSGPFMFTHVKENILNHDKVFVAMSNHVSDCYPYHMKNLPCKYLFTSSNNLKQIVNVVASAIRLSHGSILNLSEV